MSPSASHQATEAKQPRLRSGFFLSYAQMQQAFPNDRSPSSYVQEFYRDLCNELVIQDPRWQSAPGFMDHSIRGGAVWRRRLADELATCHVFMPLYTRAYFQSTFCGTEWAIFRKRQEADEAATGRPNEAIIPVLWQPIPFSELPAPAQAVQIVDDGFSRLYRENGLYRLIRLHRDEYLSVVIRLAELVSETAREAAPPPADPSEFDEDSRLFP